MRHILLVSLLLSGCTGRYLSVERNELIRDNLTAAEAAIKNVESKQRPINKVLEDKGLEWMDYAAGAQNWSTEDLMATKEGYKTKAQVRDQYYEELDRALRSIQRSKNLLPQEVNNGY